MAGADTDPLIGAVAIDRAPPIKILVVLHNIRHIILLPVHINSPDFAGVLLSHHLFVVDQHFEGEAATSLMGLLQCTPMHSIRMVDLRPSKAAFPGSSHFLLPDSVLHPVSAPLRDMALLLDWVLLQLNMAVPHSDNHMGSNTRHPSEDGHWQSIFRLLTRCGMYIMRISMVRSMGSTCTRGGGSIHQVA